jgi:hypothetical protein
MTVVGTCVSLVNHVLTCFTGYILPRLIESTPWSMSIGVKVHGVAWFNKYLYGCYFMQKQYKVESVTLM